MDGSRAEPLLLDLISRPLQWRVISRLIPPELQVTDDPRRDLLLREADGHVHPFRQVLIFLEGDALLVFDGKLYRCTPGTIAFIDPLEHHYDAPADDWRATLMYRINLRAGRVFTRLWTLRVGEPDTSDMEDILLPTGLGSALEEAWTTLRERTGPSVALRRARLLYATGLLISCLLDAPAVTEWRRGLSQEEVLSAVTDILAFDLGQGVSLQRLATLTGHSPGHFSRLFREHTGMTVHRYVEQHRIDAARGRAADGESAKLIAMRLGFSSTSAFYHWWSRKVGGRPSDLAQSRRGARVKAGDPRMPDDEAGLS